MATDQVPPIADEMPTPLPETAQARVEDDGVHADDSGYRQPEVDVDAICDGTSVAVAGILQHIEEAGVHSGDSACSIPP